MITAEEIDATPIKDVRFNFAVLMSTIVTGYGDDKEEQATEDEAQKEAKSAN
jgi:hypothetical protein